MTKITVEQREKLKKFDAKFNKKMEKKYPLHRTRRPWYGENLEKRKLEKEKHIKKRRELTEKFRKINQGLVKGRDAHVYI